MSHPSVLFLFVLCLPLVFAQHYCDGSVSPRAYEGGLLFSDILFPRVFDPQVAHSLETPIQIRAVNYLQIAGWNAWAQYLPKAADIFGRTRFKRPASENKLSNKNVALMFSLYRIYEASPSSFGGLGISEKFREVIREQGFDPDDRCANLSTAVGIGNRMGYDTALLMANDGWNQNGDRTGTQEFYKRPFKDFTGYAPKNAPQKITFPFRWQPLEETNGRGFFFNQEFVTPQAGSALSFSLSPTEMKNRKVELPYSRPNARLGKELPRDRKLLQRLAGQVLATSAKLTQNQRLLAEFFDNKVKGFNTDGFGMKNVDGQIGTFAIASVFRFGLLSKYLNFTPDDNMIYGLAANMITYDATVLAWKEKVRLDATRPTGKTMKLLFGNRRFTVWGGPRKKPMNITAGEWQPYIRTMPHAEFPSGSSCLCEALVEHALIMTKGKNDLPYVIKFPRGSSAFYPGQVPDRDTEIVIKKLTDWSKYCGKSRIWAGVHFSPSISAGRNLCKGLGRQAQNVVDGLLEGKPSGEFTKWIPLEQQSYFK